MNASNYDLRIGFLLFLASLLFSTVLLFGSVWAYSIGALAYCLALCAIFVHAKNSIPTVAPEKSAPNFLGILLANFAIALGLLLPAHIGGTAQSFFWAEDSITTHVPRAIAIAEWLQGSGIFPFSREINIQGALTHLSNGLFFVMFGASPFVTVLVLALIRACTCFVVVRLSREIFGSSKYDIAYLAYALYPNALFHTTVYYKEAMIHLTVSLVFLCFAKLMRAPRAAYLALLLLSMVAMFFERYYLVLVFLPLIFLLGCVNLKKKRVGIVAGTAALLGAVYWYHPFFDFDIEGAITRLHVLRESHSQLPGIDYKWNYEIPYVVAVIKSLFTPYWTPSKIGIFTNFSALITWGSFFGQIFIVCYILGAIQSARKFGWKHAVIQIPVLLFILFIAYISPWAGRVRDSMCPIFAVYAAFFLSEITLNFRTIIIRPSILLARHSNATLNVKNKSKSTPNHLLQFRDQ